MPGKGHVPDLTERILRTLKANTNRTAGGLGSNASPAMTRSRMAAQRRGTTGLAPMVRASKVDWFDVTGTATSAFVLTFNPIRDSWNVTVNGVDLDEDPDGPEEFQIVGKTLTITNPADTFKGVTTQGSPWRIRVQYDYLSAVPVRPTAAEPSGTDAFTATNTNTVAVPLPASEAGQTIIVAAMAYTVSTPSGWTKVAGPLGTGGTALLDVFYKVSTGSEASVNMTCAGTVDWAAAVGVYDGTIGADVEGVDETSASLVMPSLTTAAGRTVVAVVGSNDGSGLSSDLSMDSNFTVRETAQIGDVFCVLGDIIAPAGTVGATHTGTAGRKFGVTLELT